MTDTATADTGHTDPDLIASLFRRVRRLEADALLAKVKPADLIPAKPAPKIIAEPSTWGNAEAAAFDKLVALASLGVTFAYDASTRTLSLSHQTRAIDAGWITSLGPYTPALAAIFNSGIPAAIISGVCRVQSMPGVPGKIKAGCAHLLRASFTPDLLRAWDAVQVFGLGPPDSPIKSLAEAIGNTHYAVGWHRTDDRHIVRNTVLIRDKVTGEETTWRRPEPSAYANHKLAWAVNDATIQLPTPEADDGPTLPTEV